MTRQEEEAAAVKRITRWAVYAIAAVLLLVLGSCSVSCVPAGHRGVVTTFGKVNKTALNEGLNIVNPLAKVHEIQVRMIKVEVDGDAASKDMQTVTTKIALNMHLSPENTPTLYQTLGLGYVDMLVKPATEETLKAVTAQFTAEELISKRELVRAKIKDTLTTRLRERSTNTIVVDDFSITNFAFGRGFAAAIEAKAEAEQLTLKAKRDLERINVEAEQKIASAKAEAEALRLQKQEITPDLIKLRELEVQRKAIDKWDGKLPVTVAGGSIPFVNVK